MLFSYRFHTCVHYVVVTTSQTSVGVTRYDVIFSLWFFTVEYLLHRFPVVSYCLLVSHVLLAHNVICPYSQATEMPSSVNDPMQSGLTAPQPYRPSSQMQAHNSMRPTGVFHDAISQGHNVNPYAALSGGDSGQYSATNVISSSGNSAVPIGPSAG